MKQVSLDSKSYLGFLTLKTCPPLQVEQTQINFLCVERKGRGKKLEQFINKFEQNGLPFSLFNLLCPLPNSLGIFLCIFSVIQISQPKPP